VSRSKPLMHCSGITFHFSSKKTIHLRVNGGQTTMQAVSALWGPKSLDSLVELDLFFSVEPDKAAVQRLRAHQAFDGYVSTLVHYALCKAVFNSLFLDRPDPSETQVQVKGVISKFAPGCGRTGSDRQFFFVNGRPCSLPKVHILLSGVQYRELTSFECDSRFKRYSTKSTVLPTRHSRLLSLQILFFLRVSLFVCPSLRRLLIHRHPRIDTVDINVSPDKRTIFLHSEGSFVDALKAALEAAFCSSRSTFSVNNTQATATTQKTLSFNAAPKSRNSASTPPPGGTTPNDDMDVEEEGGGSVLTGLASETGKGAESADDDPREKPVPAVTSSTSDDFMPSASSGLRSSSPLIPAPSSSVPPSAAANSSPSPSRLPDARSPPSSVIVCRPGRRSIILGGPVPSRTVSAPNNTTRRVSLEQTHRPYSMQDEEDEEQLVLNTTGASWNLTSRDSSPRKGMDLGVEGDEENIRPSKRPRLEPAKKAVEGKGRVALKATLARFSNSQPPIVTLVDSEGDSENGDSNEDELQPESPAKLQADVSVVVRSPPLSTPLFLLNDESDDEDRVLPPLTDQQLKANDEASMMMVDDEDTGVRPTDADQTVSESRTSSDLRHIEFERTLDDDNERELRFDETRVAGAWESVATYRNNCSTPDPRDDGKVVSQGHSGMIAFDPEASEGVAERVITKADFDVMDVLGQFNLGFIVVRLRKDDEDGKKRDDLFIVDQHAADEKYNFETLQRTTKIASQRLFKCVVQTLPSPNSSHYPWQATGA
jgi:DNA mismatch repair protein PMS2